MFLLLFEMSNGYHMSASACFLKLCSVYHREKMYCIEENPETETAIFVHKFDPCLWLACNLPRMFPAFDPLPLC